MKTQKTNSLASTAPDYPAFPEQCPAVELQSGRYRLRFARNDADLEQVLSLRFNVFNLEMGEGLDESFATQLDRDQFDEACHHLMVTDSRSDQLVGTYRMQTPTMASEGHGFYSSQEYDLSVMPDSLLQDAVELGRACIALGHRNGRVLFLLWKGLAAYVTHNNKTCFFGCCSLTSQDEVEGWEVYASLQREGQMHKEFLVKPQPQYELPVPDRYDKHANRKLPKLMQLYINYGAVLCSEPAIDRLFKTIDYLALFDVNAISVRTRKLLFKGS